MQKVAIILFSMFAICFADSYQWALLKEMYLPVVAGKDTACLMINCKTKHSFVCKPERILQRPLVIDRYYTVRNVPYKRHKITVFELPVGGGLIVDDSENIK